MPIRKKKQKKKFTIGVAHVSAGFRNTIITLTDLLGNTLCWSSTGALGFKGSRKKTAFAAQVAAKSLVTKAMEMGIQKIEIILKGKGSGREPAIRALKNYGLQILSIQDQTPVPYNGCRPPKRRRL